MNKGEVVNPSDIASRFKSVVVDSILHSQVYHGGNIPKCRGYQCVPASYMDHIDNVTKLPTMDSIGTIVNATSIINSLVDLTRDLTRVGTFVFTVFMKTSRGTTTSIPVLESLYGDVIFSKSYIKQNFSNPSNLANTVYGNTITASNLISLFNNIYSKWATMENGKYTYRYEYRSYALTCHDSCHYDCHTNCHDNCHSSCHGWSASCHSNSNCYSNVGNLNSVDLGLNGNYGAPSSTNSQTQY